MKKHLLLLVAGAVALPGLAIADYSQSISGQVRVQHTQSTSGDQRTASNSLGGDDTHINWNIKYATDAASVSGFVRFQPSGEWRYGASGSAVDGDWTVSGKTEWDFDMTNTDSADPETTAYRDVYINAKHASGAYVQLGNMQYTDQMKGYDSSNGGGLEGGSSVNGEYDGGAFFVTDEARFAALQIGFDTGTGIDASIILQTDTDKALFGTVSNDEADDADQATSGNVLQVKYAANNVDAVVNLYNGTVSDVDTSAANSDGEAKLSATQLAVAYSVGMYTPFLNYSTSSEKQTDDSEITTTTDRTATNLGVAIALASGDGVNISVTDSAATEGDAKETSGWAAELQYSTSLGPVAFNAGYGKGSYDDNVDGSDDDDSYISLRMQYGF